MKTELGGDSTNSLSSKLSALSIANYYSLDYLSIKLTDLQYPPTELKPPIGNDFKNKKPSPRRVTVTPGNDIIAVLFSQGLHLILEKVFLRMPIRALQTCLKVNSEWEQIVQYYLNNKTCNSRLLKIKNFRLGQEWIGKNPDIQSVTLAGYRIERCFHILADSENIVIAAMAYKIDERSGMIKQFIHNVRAFHEFIKLLRA